MLNVLQVTTFFNELGGVEKAVCDLSHALAKSHRVKVLCTVKGRTVKRSSQNVEIVAAGGWLALSGRPLAFSFAQEISNQVVDVIHYHLPCPMAVISAPYSTPRAAIRVATWHHDLVRHKLLGKILRPSMERFLDSLDAIIVTAPALIEHTPLLKQFQSKCHVIPLGIDDSRFSNLDFDGVLDARARYGTPLVLFVGRLVYYKGCEVLLNAIRQIPNANLVMVGTGPLQKHLQTLIAKAGLAGRVHLVGWQPEEQLRSLIQACDVFVLPSTLPTECFGLVQVEAMLCGKPVVNTNLPTGVPWVSLHKETGLTVPAADANRLAQAIDSLLQDADWRHTLGENARRRAQELFTLRRHVALNDELYYKLLAAKSNRSHAPIKSKSH